MNINKPEYKANLLFNLINNYPIEGNESSFKMSFKTFNKIRFLIGINSHNFDITKLINICSQMLMPEQFQYLLKQNFSKSNLVLFGFEEHKNYCIYKVYLEFWEKNKQIVQKSNNNYNPLLQYIGFKWNAFDNSKNLITKYHYYPLISINTIFNLLEKIYNCKYQNSLKIVKDIINFSAKRIDCKKDSFIYLHSTDDKGMRNSYDINFYKAKVQLKDIKTSINNILINYEIEHFLIQSFIEKIQNKIFGHLSGGFDKQGNDFLTIYYEI